ncbi:unnamed protein product [Choristocarpus tenellus]
MYTPIRVKYRVVEPIRRLMFDPMAASKRSYADRVLLSTRIRHNNVGGSGRTGTNSGRSGVMDTSDNLNQGPNSSVHNQDVEVWNFERLASTPMLASAFEDFARRALCHESVQFLVDVSRYQEGNFSGVTSELGSAGNQYEVFTIIVKTYIVHSAPQEINISSRDKKTILDISCAGLPFFSYMADEERRLVFAQAYKEVCDMLEANLLQRFMQSKEFTQVRAQRATVTTMMDSPQTA